MARSIKKGPFADKHLASRRYIVGEAFTIADISLVGFDDIPLARYVHPALTTMRVDISELGARAMRMLLDAPESGAALLPQQLAAQLIARESTRGRSESA